MRYIHIKKTTTRLKQYAETTRIEDDGTAKVMIVKNGTNDDRSDDSLYINIEYFTSRKCIVSKAVHTSKRDS